MPLVGSCAIGLPEQMPCGGGGGSRGAGEEAVSARARVLC